MFLEGKKKKEKLKFTDMKRERKVGKTEEQAKSWYILRDIYIMKNAKGGGKDGVEKKSS